MSTILDRIVESTRREITAAKNRVAEAELERRPSEQLRLWVGQLSPALEAGRAWALVVAGVLGARESRFLGALADLRLAAETLEQEGDREVAHLFLGIPRRGDEVGRLLVPKLDVVAQHVDVEQFPHVLFLVVVFGFLGVWVFLEWCGVER